MIRETIKKNNYKVLLLCLITGGTRIKVRQEKILLFKPHYIYCHLNPVLFH